MHPFVEYFKCPAQLAAPGTGEPLPVEAGYFRFGDAIAYGRQLVVAGSPHADGSLADVSYGVSADDGGTVLLPFDMSEILTNLRHERYPQAQQALDSLVRARLTHRVYYALRPFLPVGVRKHLQRASFGRWRRIPFPEWPVDVTVERLMKQIVRLVLERGGVRELPFIWFWPDGAPGCVMMTHDVEGSDGARFCGQLMQLDDAFGIRSAFQVIPEAPWSPSGDTRRLVGDLQRRGFEVNVHDLSHDGHLFRDRETFMRGAAQINARGREFGSRGFRSGAMYRRQDWFEALEFSYDMSIPSVAHLEPQRGGCCTVMPFFIGRLLELPLTTSQDYTVFHVLGDYSTRLWEEQIRRILEQNGLVSFIAHPDYLSRARARAVYTDLLRLLVRLRAERHVWIALPSEIDTWWRHRQEMTLVPDGTSWRVEGPDSARARVAYARLEGGNVVYDIEPTRRAA